ncbi:MAG: hypothetical protein QXT97_02555 [Candidatus Diapherotrites archaeon]
MYINHQTVTINGEQFTGTLVKNIVSFIGSGQSIDQNLSDYFYLQATNKIRIHDTVKDAQGNAYVVVGIVTLPNGQMRLGLWNSGVE